MNYSELLSSYIKQSKMSLSEISDKLKEKGFSTDKGYLSKLQNGKIPPAGEKLNLALADILNGNAKRLEFSAYVEKAPDDLTKLILSNLDENLINSYILFSDKFHGRTINFIGENDPDIEESEEFKKIKEFSIKHFGDLFLSGKSSIVNELTLAAIQEVYKEYSFSKEDKERIKEHLENYGLDSTQDLINSFIKQELKKSNSDENYGLIYRIQDPELHHWYQTLPLAGEKKLRKLRTIWEMIQNDDE